MQKEHYGYFLRIGLGIFILLVACLNLETIFAIIGRLFTSAIPIFIGFGIAFICHRPFLWLQKFLAKELTGLGKTGKRLLPLLSIFLLYMTLFLIIGILLSLFIPQLEKSILLLSGNLQGYLKSLEQTLTALLDYLPFLSLKEEEIGGFISTLPSLIMEFSQRFFPSIFHMTKTAFSFGVNLLIGLIIGGYILNDLTALQSLTMAVINRYLPPETAQKLCGFGGLCYDTCSRYIAGQALEGVILGSLCLVGMMVLGFPYPLPISFLIGITGLIPIAGAFIGAIPSFLLLFIVSPKQALWFIPFIILIQQIEGDFIYPKIVGDSIGLPPFWVMVGVLLGGGLGGILGILLGIPILSICYQLLQRDLHPPKQE